MDYIELFSIAAAAFAVSFGALGPALAEGRSVAAAMDAIARQPDAAGAISPSSNAFSMTGRSLWIMPTG